MVKKATITFGGIDGNITKKVVTDSATAKMLSLLFSYSYFKFIMPIDIYYRLIIIRSS